MGRLLEAKLYSVASGEERWFVVACSSLGAEQTVEKEKGLSLGSIFERGTEFVARVHYISPTIYDQEFELRAAAKEEILWSSETDVLT